MNIVGIILGPNGAGKGTLADGISKVKPNYTHINSGKVIKEWARAYNLEKVIDLINNGKLVSNNIVKKAIRDKFKSLSNYYDVIIEGFPRLISQNKLLFEICEAFDYKIKWMINLYLPFDIVLQRIKYRVLSENGVSYNILYNPPPDEIREKVQVRPDDVPDIARLRYDIFIHESMMCISDPHFLGVPIKTIDARKGISEILDEALNFLDQINKKIE